MTRAALAAALALAAGCTEHPAGSMVLVSQTPLAGTSTAATADTLYVALALHVASYDLADPRRPVAGAMLTTDPMSVTSVAVEGDRLHAWGGGYALYDLTAAPPAQVFWAPPDVDSNGWTAIATHGDTAFAIDLDKGVIALDLATHAELGRLDFPSEYLCNAAALDPAGQVLYVGCSYALHVVDVSDPSAPVELAALTDVAGVTSLLADGDLLYGANWTNLLVLDVGAPAAPVVVDDRDAGFAGLGRMVVLDGQLYAGGSTSLVQYDLADPRHPALAHHLDLDNVAGLSTANGLLYAMASGAVVVVDPAGR